MVGVALPSSHVLPDTGRIVFILSFVIVGAFVEPLNLITTLSPNSIFGPLPELSSATALLGVAVEAIPKLPVIATVDTIALPVESAIVPSIVIVPPTTTVGLVGVVAVYVAGPLKVIVNVSLATVV